MSDRFFVKEMLTADPKDRAMQKDREEEETIRM